MPKYSIGLDFGTNSCRSVLINLENRSEVSSEIYDYPTGENGVLLDPKDPNLARQNPVDYSTGIIKIIKGVIEKARDTEREFDPKNVIGIGIDATSSSPIPVAANCIPLAFNPEFGNNLNAMVWLWKDHTGFDEACRITETAEKSRPEYLSGIGGAYSAEWFWSKLLHLKNIDPFVFKNTYSFVELCDYIPALLTGVQDPQKIKRSVCAAGHKAMFNVQWGGLPDERFLYSIDPELSSFRQRLYSNAYPSDYRAGSLSRHWSEMLGLSEHTVVAVGIIDAHAGAVGSGVKEGTLVQIIGTSTCDITVSSGKKPVHGIPGVSGVVKDSVIPGLFGIEAGQPAVGDIFLWFVNQAVPDYYGKTTEEKFVNLELESMKLKAGENGLLALDWNNGNRSILLDFRLSGLLIGQTLYTKAHEIYRALIEATAFGVLKIINRFEEFDIKINEIINCGGLSHKNPLLMQIYADVTNRQMKIAESRQTGALGAAIFGAVAAGVEMGGFQSTSVAQKLLTGVSEIYYPSAENQKIYKKLFELYSILYDAFGNNKWTGSLFDVMKQLLTIRETQRQSR